MGFIKAFATAAGNATAMPGVFRTEFTGKYQADDQEGLKLFLRLSDIARDMWVPLAGPNSESGDGVSLGHLCSAAPWLLVG